MNADDAIIAKKKKKGERLENGHAHYLEQGPRPKKPMLEKKEIATARRQGHLQDDTLTILL